MSNSKFIDIFIVVYDYFMT